MKRNRKNKPSVRDKRVMIGFLWWPKKAYSIKCDCSQWRWLERAMWVEEWTYEQGDHYYWKVTKWFETDGE